MFQFIPEMLQCPVCHAALEWDVDEQQADRIQTATAHCTECGATYPVRDGIGIFLTPDLPRNDLWEQVGSELSSYLEENPRAAARLMGPPATQLNPADRFFRGLVLEERGEFESARAVLQAANADLYSPEYLICHESQIHYLVHYLEKSQGPIVDLACGRAHLVEILARQLERPIIATDFSLRVLRRNRRWLQAFGLLQSVSLLAFDARRTPFKDGAVRAMTTNLGLPNIETPGLLLQELRRVISGEFLAIHTFYPPEDAANAGEIEKLGLPLLYQGEAQQQFADAGWALQIVNRCIARACPTPRSQILEGAGIDNLPVAETELEWCILRSR